MHAHPQTNLLPTRACSGFTQHMHSTGRFTPELRRLAQPSYNVCRSCGSTLTTGSPAHAGYTADGLPRYVGTCCAGVIHELASFMYWWWHADRRVDPATPLWRYMDFEKFISLLEERAPYFARADKLGDKFEGASGISQRQDEWDALFTFMVPAARRANASALRRASPRRAIRTTRRALYLMEQGAAVGRPACTAKHPSRCVLKVAGNLQHQIRRVGDSAPARFTRESHLSTQVSTKGKKTYIDQ